MREDHFDSAAFGERHEYRGAAGMRTFGRFTVVLALGLASLQISAPSFGQDAQAGGAVSQSARAFGAGNPFTLGDLPPGRLRQHLEGLPSAAQQRALDWLHSFDFTEGDLPHLRVDPAGGVFYEDPIVEGSAAEEAGGGQCQSKLA